VNFIPPLVIFKSLPLRMPQASYSTGLSPYWEIDTAKEFEDEWAWSAILFCDRIQWTDKKETIQTRIQTKVCIVFGDDFI